MLSYKSTHPFPYPAPAARNERPIARGKEKSNAKGHLSKRAKRKPINHRQQLATTLRTARFGLNLLCFYNALRSANLSLNSNL